jgi:hypothetical protein
MPKVGVANADVKMRWEEWHRAAGLAGLAELSPVLAADSKWRL